MCFSETGERMKMMARTLRERERAIRVKSQDYGQCVSHQKGIFHEWGTRGDGKRGVRFSLSGHALRSGSVHAAPLVERERDRVSEREKDFRYVLIFPLLLHLARSFCHFGDKSSRGKVREG